MKKYKIFIFIALFFIILFINMKTLYNNINIQITYETNSDGSIQLFYDNFKEYPFDEINSQRKIIKSNKNLITFTVPSTQLEKIRIDFEGEMSKIILKNIKYSKFGIQIKDLKINKENNHMFIQNDISIYYENKNLVIDIIGNDPYIGYHNIIYTKIDKLIMFTLASLLSLIISYLIILILKYTLDKNLIKTIVDNKITLLLIFSFILFITLPNLLFYFFAINTILFKDGKGENRILKEKPILSVHNIKEYPKEFETYYTDNLPFKSDFVTLNSYIKYKFLNKSPVDYVIKGKEDWLFYNSKYRGDADEIADYRGTNHYTNEQLELIKQNVLSKKAYLDEKGIEFYLFIAPNKTTIYSEYVPNYFKPITSKSRVDILVEYLKENTDINIIYPKQELLEAKNQYQVYYKLDTHWNNLGAYIGAKQLINKINISDKLPELNNLVITNSTIKTGDLSSMINIVGWLNDTEYIIDNYKADIVAEIIENENSKLRYKSNNYNNNKLLMFRDSFTTALTPYLTKEFEESLFIWNHSFNKELIEEENPSIVITEFVERYANLLNWN